MENVTAVKEQRAVRRRKMHFRSTKTVRHAVRANTIGLSPRHTYTAN